MLHIEPELSNLICIDNNHCKLTIDATIYNFFVFIYFHICYFIRFITDCKLSGKLDKN
jgi:hypothetical protein